MSNSSDPGAPRIWGNLLHLSYNMWDDHVHPDARSPYVMYRPYLRFDESLWNDLLAQMSRAGMNMVVLDRGDGVRYDSHPEIAVTGAWTPDKLRAEIAKMRGVGLEPIPKLNFSTAHDAWLAEYSRMVSTPRYYDVCRDLIEEVCALFDSPRLFHIGMDEEACVHQKDFEYVVVRQKDLWWRDLAFFVAHVEAGGSRAWVWSDYAWVHPADFYAKMPKTVVQSNWYYKSHFASDREPGPPRPYEYEQAYRTYLDLEDHGYDQIPTTSNWTTPDNMDATVQFCTEHLAPERLLGFLQTPWRPTLEECRPRHESAIDLAKAARERAGERNRRGSATSPLDDAAEGPGEKDAERGTL